MLKKATKFINPNVATSSKKKKGGQNTERPARLIGEEEGLIMNPLSSAGNYQVDETSLREMTFSNIGGTIAMADRDRFYRMIYRATRGNCMIRFSSLSDRAKDATGKRIDKTCFIIFYKSAAIETKLKRICDAFSANRYDLTEIHREEVIRSISEQNQREMKETKKIIDANTEAKLKICVEVAQNLEEWLWSVRREKGIYHTLNLFKNDVAGNLLRGRGWILSDSLNAAKAMLKRAHGGPGNKQSGASSALLEKVTDSWPTPPTRWM